MTPTFDLAPFIQAIAVAVADELERRRLVGGGSVKWAHGRDNPFGSRTLFLQAAKRGDFPTFKQGRKIVAKWTDVEASMMSNPTQARKPPIPVAPPLTGQAWLDSTREERHRRMTEPRKKVRRT